MNSTFRFRVVRHHIEVGRDRYGRCEDTWCEQKLIREQLWCGMVVFRKVIDMEIVPVYAWAGQACLGDTGGWVSKFAPFNRDGIVDKWPRE